MEIIDIILGVILLYGLVKGIMKGLLAELASLLALVLGIYGSIHFSFYIKGVLLEYLEWEPKMIALAAFAITFLVIVITISLVGKILTKLASVIALGFLNKILGALFGLIKVGLILSVLLGWIEKANGIIPFISKEQKQNSILFNPVKNLAPAIFPTLMEQLGKNESSEENKQNDEKNI